MYDKIIILMQDTLSDIFKPASALHIDKLPIVDARLPEKEVFNLESLTSFLSVPVVFKQ